MAENIPEFIPTLMAFKPMEQLPENWVQAWLHAGSAIIDKYGKNELSGLLRDNAALRVEIKKYFTSCSSCVKSLSDCMGTVVHSFAKPDQPLNLEKVCQALQQDKPVVLEVYQMGKTDHWFMMQPLPDGRIHIVDAWQGKHPVRISSTHGKQELQHLLKDLISDNRQLRDMAAKALFGADHGFVQQTGHLITMRSSMTGEAGKGLAPQAARAPRSQRAASMEGLVLKGKDFEMRIERAFSMDDGLPRGAEPFKQNPQKPSAAGQIATGAALGASFGFVLSLYSVLSAPNGRTAGQKTEDVLVPTAVGAAEGAGAVAVMRALENSSAGARAFGGAGVAAAGAAVMIGWDAIKMARGRATVVELRRNAAANLGAGGGGLAGAAGGAALGSLVGPIGTVVGGLVGGIAAGFGGAKGGELMDRAIWDQEEDVKEQAFEFMHFSYTRWATPPPRSPEELQGRYEKRVQDNPEDREWVLQCQQNLRIVMSELWPKVHELENLVEEELNNMAQDK